MNIKLTTVAVAMTAFWSLNANALYIAPLQVEEIQVVSSETGNSVFEYTVDGVEIELTEKDKIRAKNWNLTNADWAKYKYLMEYTPRGMWTPNIDPPLALGNAAQTEKDRYYYINIQNQIEMARTKADDAMLDTTNRLIALHNPSIKAPVSQLQSQLPTNKDTLRSIFVDLNDCDAQCKTFVTLAIASSSSSTQLDMHFNGGDENNARAWLSQIGVDENKIQTKGINISAMYRNETVKKFANGVRGAFYLNKTESGTIRYEN